MPTLYFSYWSLGIAYVKGLIYNRQQINDSHHHLRRWFPNSFFKLNHTWNSDIKQMRDAWVSVGVGTQIPPISRLDFCLPCGELCRSLGSFRKLKARGLFCLFPDCEDWVPGGGVTSSEYTVGLQSHRDSNLRSWAARLVGAKRLTEWRLKAVALGSFQLGSYPASILICLCDNVTMSEPPPLCETQFSPL